MNQQVNNNNQPVLPRRSRRLATIIPASHWIGLGYSEDDAQSMVMLQTDMKEYGDWKFRYSNKSINLVGSSDDNMLPHHDLMIPHWNKLFKAIDGRTSVDYFYIGDLCMPGSVLDIMFPALQSLNLNTLYLSQVGLESDGYKLLASFLKENSTLKMLLLSENEFDDVSAASSFSDAVKINPSLEILSFSSCSLCNKVLREILEGCKRKSQLGLELHMESFGSDAIAIMADYISSNHLLLGIDMSGNRITDSDATQLAAGLKKNTNLHWLEIHNNDITEEGEMCLRKVLFDPTSIDSIVQSNHRCRVYTYDNNARDNSIIAHRPPPEKEVLRINKEECTIGQKIRKKVVLALCGSNRELFDLAFLNDMSLELMPRMLELTQEYGRTRTEAFRCMMPEDRADEVLEAIDRYIGPWPSSKQLEKDALSRLYHTLRGWELPSLFVNLRTPSANISTGKRKRRKTCRH